MTEQSPAEAIFFTALEKGSPTERAAYLDLACGEDRELRGRVERLLSAHPKVGSFLEVLAQPEVTADYSESSKVAGTVIAGRYKLIEQIGEGGMGTVWMAQQTEPVKRMVAVKLIKAGMDSKSVLARFEAERQALALMDHPNIAKVLDAGATDDGRPFFVMELVKGVPITSYCDEQKLPLTQRLDLFVFVCHAVQHAHQKGVIHRDLKPSNVLVAHYDDQPVPKVIDFGIAKAAGQPLTDRTLVTGFGAVVGTPEYMSPEQAQLNQLDIDTRSDIYALGVLLYELLTGSTPVTRQELEKAGFLEVLRMIREQEPPRPSTRLSRSATLPEIAASRSSGPGALAGLIRNDLDWIVMKALEKDRNRRYETANDFAADIRRYLEGDAVQAHPPTTNYLLRKFARKHRVAITTASAFAALLMVAVALSSLFAVKASRAEAIAENKRIEAEVNSRTAELHSKQAQQYSDLLEKETREHLFARMDIEVKAMGLQVELDLTDFQFDPRVGILRLARTLNKPPPVFKRVGGRAMFDENGKIVGPLFSETVPIDLLVQPLREFVTLTVLTTAQSYAPLLPPITHDGQAVSRMQISPDYKTLMTLGTDDTGRLWDMRTGKNKAILRKASETIVNAGFSPDGKVVFTDDSSGIARIWEVDSGSYRCEIPRRDNLFPTAVENKPYDFFADLVAAAEQRMDRSACISIGDSRLLTQRVVAKTRAKDDPRGPGNDHEVSGPIELWDTKTGMFVARLDKPDQRTERYRWFNGGKWLVTHEGLNKLSILSGQDGQLITQLELPNNEKIYSQSLQVSPDGQRIALITMRVESEKWKHVRVRLWDARTWKEREIERPHFIDKVAFLYVDGKDVFRLWNDEVFSVSGGALLTEHAHYLFKFGNNTPIAEADGWAQPNSAETHLVMATDGRVFDTTDAKQHIPEFGTRFNGSLHKFSRDGRFVITSSLVDFMFYARKKTPFRLIDLKTDKWVMLSNEFERESPLGRLPDLGLANVKDAYGVQIQFLPTLIKGLNISPDHLELWTQVAVRGQLSNDGKFVKWDELTWEKKRQELAAKPIPYADFPFPGFVAMDTLHWLRQEFQNVANDEKPRLAKQLLERAKADGNQTETVRWRNWLSANAKPPRNPTSEAKE